MTEEEARATVFDLVGSAGYSRLETLAIRVSTETQRQNLIARSTIATMWCRHILDSVQLLRWGADWHGVWLDVGTGGGFPGMAIAAATDGHVVLAEPRRLRATFLTDTAATLGLRRTTVMPQRVETIRCEAAIVSARAVAPFSSLLSSARHCATAETHWLFLHGRASPADDIVKADRQQMTFHVEQSLSDPCSSIVIARGVPA